MSYRALPKASSERQQRVEDAIHANEMEGPHINADTLGDADEYVGGRIDSDELAAGARIRYGLDARYLVSQRGYGPGGGVKIAWVPMRRQMTWACPAIRSWP
jgi:Antitoxin VbhA